MDSPRFPFSRSGDVVEYLLKSQWFVRCREMGDRAAQVRLHCKEGLGPGDAAGLSENWNEDIGRLEALLPHSCDNGEGGAGGMVA